MRPDTLKRRIRSRLTDQRLLVERMLELREQVPGSLFARYGRCGKPSCTCAGGRGHGPYYVLSHRSGGRGRFAYVARGRAGEARQLVRRYRQFRTGLRRLRGINEELVVLLRRYQERTAEQAGRSLGLEVAPVEKT